MLFILVAFYNQNENDEKENKEDVFCKNLTYNNPSFFDSCKKNYLSYKFIKSKLIPRINYRIEQNKIYNERVKKINKIDLNINKKLYKRMTWKELGSQPLKNIANKKIKFYTYIEIPKLDKFVIEKDTEKVYKIRSDNIVEFNLYNHVSMIADFFDDHGDDFLEGIQDRGVNTETFFDSVKVRKKIIQIKDCMIPINNRETHETMLGKYEENYSERFGFLSNSEYEINTNFVCFPKNYYSNPFFSSLHRFDFLNWGNLNSIKNDVFILIEAYRTDDNYEIIKIYIKDIIFKEINKSPEDILSEVILESIYGLSFIRKPDDLKNFKEFAKIFWNKQLQLKKGSGKVIPRIL